MRHGDLTEGSISRRLIIFTVPILLSNFLQQLYGVFDAVIVGNYISNNALAAIGLVGPLVNMLIAFFVGMSAGASVLVSQYYGSRDRAKLMDTLYTALSLSFVMGAALTAIGVLVSPTILRWMNTPADVLPDAIVYLRIYFIGMIALTTYNIGSGVLRAMGDSTRPLYFLVVSTIVKIACNFLFVTRFHWDVAGVSWATNVAQVISASLVLITLSRSNTGYRVNLRRLRMRLYSVKQIMNLGLPGGIQQSIVSLSNIIVQSYINGLGALAVAGYSASSRVDGFVFLPASALAVAVTTFVGQNLGAGQVRRARQGTRHAFIIALGCTIALSVTVLMYGKVLLRAFTPDPDVIEYGYSFMKVYAAGYALLCLTQILPGALRGAGDVRFSAAAAVACFVVIRQMYLFIITKAHYTLSFVALSYPATWFICAVIISVYYLRSDWSHFESEGAETYGKNIG